MKRIFRGSLQGYLCDSCHESLENVEVLLYRPYRKEIVTSAVIDAKETFHYVSPEEAKQRDSFLIGKTKSDAFGNFEIEVNEKYAEFEAFDIDFICGSVPKKFPKPKGGIAPQFHITTVPVRWRYLDNEVAVFNWKYFIPKKWWCYIRGHFFDAWVICGRLLSCENETPIPNAKVTAYDADFITDDNLGSAITDAQGHFRIDYNSLTFKQTFLSPWINVETDPGPGLTFKSGPDVYFKAEIGSTILIDEKKSDARKNVSYCTCVTLCSKVNIITDENDQFPSAWTGIGKAFSASYGTGIKDFDIDGFGGTGKYALTGIVNLTGQAALKSPANNPIEYRFLISDTSTPNGGPAPSISNFTKIIGVTSNLFRPSEVLTLSRKISLPSNNEIPVYSHQDDFDSNGWFHINTAIDRALINAGLTPSDIHLFNIIEADPLISLDTRALTTQANLPSGLVASGDPIPSGDKLAVEKFAIRFEIRDAVTQIPLAGSGKTLNCVAMNNNNIFMKLDIQELLNHGLCTPISGDIHAKYTVYHPLLLSSRLHLRNNSLTVDRNIVDGTLPLSGNTSLSTNECTNSSSKLNNPPTPTDMTRCTYSLKLYARARLHNGENPTPEIGPVEQVFYYEI